MLTQLQNARVLVTGGAGFIGSHLARRLVEEGAVVHVADEADPRAGRLADLQDRITYHRLDLLDAAAVSERLRRIDPVKVYHLAAHTNVRRGFETADDAVADLRATINLLRAVEGRACDGFVQTGTCEEYGDGEAPFREEQMPSPVSPYSASKTAQTFFALMCHRTLGAPVVVLRPFLTYGPGQAPSRFISQAIECGLSGAELPMTGGEQTREFNYVSDIADGFVRASVTPAAVGEIINIGNGVEVSLRQVVEEISRALGSPVKARFGAIPYRPGEAWHFYGDHSKARRILGWAPHVDLAEGLRRTVAWCRATAPGRCAPCNQE